MGTRIRKQIGYFISPKVARNIFVKDYKSVIENLQEDENTQAKFLSTIQAIIDDNENKPFNVWSFEIKMFLKFLLKQSSIKFIDTIEHGDDYKGVLISTPSMLESARYDDNIDYYENENFRFKLNKLNRPIYPVSGFIYANELNELNEFGIKPYSEISSHISVYARAIHDKYYPGKTYSDKNIYKTLAKNKHFHPCSEEYLYPFVKATGILKDNVTDIDFQLALEPSIVTTWG